MSYQCRELLPVLGYVSMANAEYLGDEVTSKRVSQRVDRRGPADGLLAAIQYDLFDQYPAWRNEVRRIEAEPVNMRHAGCTSPWRNKTATGANDE